jgi:hypothetical protein
MEKYMVEALLGLLFAFAIIIANLVSTGAAPQFIYQGF